MKTREGTVSSRAGQTWFTVVGEQRDGRLPLLVLNGGPGIPHGALLDLAPLADTGRQVVFYDQVGCGQSAPVDDLDGLDVATFAGQLADVRTALGLDAVHILGHSWGVWLALEHVLGGATGVASLILSDCTASAADFEAGALALKAGLPDDVRDTLERHEAAGTTDDVEYVVASMAFITRHVIRADPIPDHVAAAFLNMSRPVYETMWGPSEFHCTGKLRTWSAAERLGEVDVPTLVISGRHDEATPEQVAKLARGIRGAEWIVFEDSAHVPMAEEPERYREAVSGFLAEVEAGGRRG